MLINRIVYLHPVHVKMPNEPVLRFSVFIIISGLATDFAAVGKPTYYILHWHSTESQEPYRFLGRGRRPFLVNNCQYKNCYITKNERHFSNKDKFHAIVFDVVDLTQVKLHDIIPAHRNFDQKYIFTAVESEVNYDLCRKSLDNFFNWTWTYRLDSDFRRGFITVYDLRDNIVGPRVGKTWPKGLRPIDAEFKYKIKFKTQIAAWFRTDCDIKDDRIHFVREVQKVLFLLEGVTVDIFNGCNQYDCTSNSLCGSMLKRSYLFYFVFENSIARDYISEKLMVALDNYSVPVVYGGANYSMFLPPGSYLDARELGPERLAKKMLHLKSNRKEYHNFFRWRNHYKYRDTTASDICTLCQMMNEQRTQVTAKEDFMEWWTHGSCDNKEF